MNFGQWLKQAYGVDSNDYNARFTVYNIEVAFDAGKKSTGWVSVKETLPDEFKECILYPYPNEYEITGFRSSKGFFTRERDFTGMTHRKLDNVTHWKYLDEPGVEMI